MVQFNIVMDEGMDINHIQCKSMPVATTVIEI